MSELLLDIVLVVNEVLALNEILVGFGLGFCVGIFIFVLSNYWLENLKETNNET